MEKLSGTVEFSLEGDYFRCNLIFNNYEPELHGGKKEEF